MGADAYAYLYLGYKLEEIYEEKTVIDEWDLHDQKTGKKTGKKGREEKTAYVNKFTGKEFDDIDDIDSDNIHILYEEGDYDDYIIGIKLGDDGDEITLDKLEEQKLRLDKLMRKHFDDSTVTPTPRLIVNLYWSC